MDLESAISKHAEWKTKLAGAISSKQTLDAGTISKDNCCELGKWLYGDAKSMYGSLKTHADCVARHSAFHVEAGKVASAINAGKYSEAQTMLGWGTPYTAASSAVAAAIRALKQEASL